QPGAGRRAARDPRLPGRAALLLRPQAGGVRRGVGRRLAAHAGVPGRLTRRMPARRLLIACALAALTLGPAARAQAPVTVEPPDTNPCHDAVLALKCPDLRMAPPSDLHVRRAGRVLQLLATNRIVNVGAGPLELRAEHTGDPRSSAYRFAPA